MVYTLNVETEAMGQRRTPKLLDRVAVVNAPSDAVVEVVISSIVN